MVHTNFNEKLEGRLKTTNIKKDTTKHPKDLGMEAKLRVDCPTARAVLILIFFLNLDIEVEKRGHLGVEAQVVL